MFHRLKPSAVAYLGDYALLDHRREARRYARVFVSRDSASDSCGRRSRLHPGSTLFIVVHLRARDIVGSVGSIVVRIAAPNRTA